MHIILAPDSTDQTGFFAELFRNESPPFAATSFALYSLLVLIAEAHPGPVDDYDRSMSGLAYLDDA